MEGTEWEYRERQKDGERDRWMEGENCLNDEFLSLTALSIIDAKCEYWTRLKERSYTGRETEADFWVTSSLHRFNRPHWCLMTVGLSGKDVDGSLKGNIRTGYCFLMTHDNYFAFNYVLWLTNVTKCFLTLKPFFRRWPCYITSVLATFCRSHVWTSTWVTLAVFRPNLALW